MTQPKVLSPKNIHVHIDSLWTKWSGQVAKGEQKYSQVMLSQGKQEWNHIINKINNPITQTRNQSSTPNPYKTCSTIAKFDGFSTKTSLKPQMTEDKISTKTMGKLGRCNSVCSMDPRVMELEKIKGENKQLYPEDFFKHKICNGMNIDLDWLEETNARVRFRQNVIEQIAESERESTKSTKILQEYLNQKRRDKLPIFTNEEKATTIKRAKLEVNFKAFTIRNNKNQQVVVQRTKSTMRTPRKRQLSSVRSSEKTGSVMKSTGKKGLNQNKALVTAAEELQREIIILEDYVDKDKSTTKNRIYTITSSNSRRGSMTETFDSIYKNLTNSILDRARKVNQAKNNAMAKVGAVARCMRMMKKTTVGSTILSPP